MIQKMESNLFKPAIESFITNCGENSDSECFKETPDRFFKGLQEFCSGYFQNFSDVNKTFPNQINSENIIISKNIEFFSLCAHHMLPFYGFVHIGYIPGKEIYGLSKLARAVEIYSKRLQDQEKLTMEIAHILMSSAEINGIIVLIESKHFCSCGRGIKKSNASMTTICKLGSMNKHENLELFLKLVEDRLHP